MKSNQQYGSERLCRRKASAFRRNAATIKENMTEQTTQSERFYFHHKGKFCHVDVQTEEKYRSFYCSKLQNDLGQGWPRVRKSVLSVVKVKGECDDAKV